jgi:hypothetical protein
MTILKEIFQKEIEELAKTSPTTEEVNKFVDTKIAPIARTAIADVFAKQFKSIPKTAIYSPNFVRTPLIKKSITSDPVTKKISEKSIDSLVSITIEFIDSYNKGGKSALEKIIDKNFNQIMNLIKEIFINVISHKIV